MSGVYNIPFLGHSLHINVCNEYLVSVPKEGRFKRMSMQIVCNFIKNKFAHKDLPTEQTFKFFGSTFFPIKSPN